MGHEYFWWGGMWIFPTIMLVVMLVIVYLIFGRGSFRPPWRDFNRYTSEIKDSESALEILKKRYAKGEITKEEFDKMKKDVL